MEKDYVPFGDQWKNEMKKFTKDQLIDMLREKLILIQEIRHTEEKSINEN